MNPFEFDTTELKNLEPSQMNYAKAKKIGVLLMLVNSDQMDGQSRVVINYFSYSLNHLFVFSHQNIRKRPIAILEILNLSRKNLYPGHRVHKLRTCVHPRAFSKRRSSFSQRIP